MEASEPVVQNNDVSSMQRADGPCPKSSGVDMVDIWGKGVKNRVRFLKPPFILAVLPIPLYMPLPPNLPIASQSTYTS